MKQPPRVSQGSRSGARRTGTARVVSSAPREGAIWIGLLRVRYRPPFSLGPKNEGRRKLARVTANGDGRRRRGLDLQGLSKADFIPTPPGSQAPAVAARSELPPILC